MVQIVERVQAHYESSEVPFGKTYEWHPAYVAIECECGQKVILGTTTITTCRWCSADLSAFVHGLQEREASLPDKLTHPWFYDSKERAQQHHSDEEAYPEGSPWRYNDITGASNEE
jgi:hypothetical protein